MCSANPRLPDAKYVHFFHEKIPSRAMEHFTPLDPLNDIISALPMDQQAPPLRTRALVQIFKEQYEGAVHDLTTAIRITEELRRLHKPDQQQLELASRMRVEQRSVPQLKEQDQPKSLDMQLYFNRGGVYLTIACQSVHAALNGLKEYREAQERGDLPDEVAQAAHAARLEARKRVKTNAKRALKDYTQFLSNFDYTPGLPFEITNEIMHRVYDLANGNRIHTTLSRNRLVELEGENGEVYEVSDHTNANANDKPESSLVKHQNPKPDPLERGDHGWSRFPSPKIHPSSSLFAEKPPADLPPFPSNETKTAMLNNDVLHEAFGSREAVNLPPPFDRRPALPSACACTTSNQPDGTPSPRSQRRSPCANCRWLPHIPSSTESFPCRLD
nr:hypothetical protein CFP56_37310 [Quercus suber]